MKAIILAGGLPSIVEDRFDPIPKPMAEIGGRPILWHIMKNYASQGIKDFIICVGYKGDCIKNYFMNYYLYQSDITVDLGTNHIDIHRKKTEDWKVTIVDTGKDSSIAQRLLMIKEYIEDEDFLVTYGDCVSDINIDKMKRQHYEKGKIVTMAVATPTGRNKILPITQMGEMAENVSREHMIACTDACTMIFNGNIFPYLEKYWKDDVMSEDLMNELVHKGELSVYLHDGFWAPMETARDKNSLEQMYLSKTAPWKIWKN